MSQPPRKRRRWPIWSEPQSPSVPCNLCGFSGSHSNVCPFGPEPTRSKERRLQKKASRSTDIADYLPEYSVEQAADAAQDARELGLEREES